MVLFALGNKFFKLFAQFHSFLPVQTTEWSDKISFCTFRYFIKMCLKSANEKINRIKPRTKRNPLVSNYNFNAHNSENMDLCGESK